MQRLQEPGATPNYDDLYNAIETVGPRVYRLITDGDSENITIALIGCQGNGKISQHEVAKLMDEKGTKPDIILGLGDNLYDDGAATPDDDQFREYFYKVYDRVELNKNLRRHKHFLILGNHDENRHRATRYKSYVTSELQGKDAARNEVAHTYISKQPEDSLDDSGEHFSASFGTSPSFEDYVFVRVNQKDLVKQFCQPELKIKDLDLWNMPYYFYSLILGDTQIFCLNSNTYARDFLEFHQKKERFQSPESVRSNQAAWLDREYRAAIEAGRKIIIAQHHPLFTSGKRADPAHYDTVDYLSEQEKVTLKVILGCQSDSYNEILRQLFEFQKFKFDLVAVAHDHCLQYYNEKSPGQPTGLCQITSGGGGGDLQKRTHFFGYEHVGCYLKNNGFVSLTFAKVKPQQFHINFYSTAGHHLRFTDESHFAICAPIEDRKLDMLRTTILKSVDEYFSLLLSALLYRKKQAESTSTVGNFISRFSSSISAMASYLTSYDNIKKEDIDEIHNITAYLNQTYLPEFNIVIEKLFELFSKLSNTSLEHESHPFYTFKHDIDKFKHYQGMGQVEARNAYILKLTKCFTLLHISYPELIAEKLYEFSKTLTGDKHPFLALVNNNLAAQFKGLELFDLHPANLRHFTFT